MLISMENIFDWAGSNEAQRKFIDGERVYAAGHLIVCGEKDKSEIGDVKVLAACLQTSHLRDKPHDISGLIEETGKIKQFKCSCKAGESGQCKHVMATLLHIYCNYELTELSCTDNKCEWKKQHHLAALQKYDPVKLKDHKCKPQETPEEPIEEVYDSPLTYAQKNQLLHHIFELPNSGITKQKNGRHEKFTLPEESSCTPEEQDAIAKIFEKQQVLSSTEVMNEVKKLDVGEISECCAATFEKCHTKYYDVCLQTKMYYDAWLKERQTRITGTTCYGLYTYINNKKADWKKKFQDTFHPKSFTSSYTEYGKKNEDKARKKFIESINHPVFCTGLVISAINPWLACSPDGVVFKDDKPFALLEIKCPIVGKTCNIQETVESSTAFLTKDGERIVLKKRHAYYGQIQLGMSVLNVKLTYFVIYSLFDNNIFVIEVERDDTFLLKMLSALKKLYFNKLISFMCSNHQSSGDNQLPVDQ